MASFFSALICIVFFVVGIHGLTAPAWPTFWSANWNFVEENNPNREMERGLWFYNVTTSPGLLRQDNDIDCPVSAFHKVCRAIFRSNNIYLYNPNENNLCCQCWPNVPPTQPNWLVPISRNSGNAVYPPFNEACVKWTFESTHTYWSDASTAYPVAEAGGGSTLQWQNISTASNAFNSNVFQIPSGCTKGCNELFGGPNGEPVLMPRSLSKFIDLRDSNGLQQFHCGM